ncbi:MAG: hypothetical protein WCP87_04110, partial [Atribacterota bacterium]
MCRFLRVFFLFIMMTTLAMAEENAIELTGERLTYLSGGEEAIAYNGKLTHKDFILEAQKIHIYLKKKELEAEGNVKVTQGKEEFLAETASYNWDTEGWRFRGVKSEFTGKSIAGKVFFQGKTMDKKPDLTTVDQSIITSCDLMEPHYHIDAKKIEIIPDKKVILHGISYWDFGIKLFTLPYYVIFLDRKEQLPFIPVIGQSSATGYYINLFFNYFVNKESYGTIYLDWYQKNGWGVGVRHYIEREKPFEKGQLYLYYSDKEGTDQDTLKGNLQYQKKLDQYTDLNISIDYNRLLEAQTDTFSGQLALSRKQGRTTTSLNLSYNSDTANENSNLTANLDYGYDFGNQWSGKLTLAYKDLSQWGNYDDLDLRYFVSVQKASGSFNYILRYEGHSDLEGDVYTGDPGRFVFKTPELEISGAKLRIGKSDFYYQTSFLAAHYSEEETGVEGERYRLSVRWEGNSQLGPNTTVKPVINFIQDFYGNGFARYIWEGNLAVTQNSSHQVNLSLSYNRSGYDGATPFKFDYTARETNYASLGTTDKNGQWEAGVDTGYDFMGESFTSTIFSLKYTSDKDHSLLLRGSYDFNQGEWLGLSVGTSWRFS